LLLSLLDAAFDVAVKLTKTKTIKDAAEIHTELLQADEQTQDAVSLAMKASMEVFETWTTPLDIGIYRAKLISDAVASE